MDKDEHKAFLVWKNYQESRTNFLPDWYKYASEKKRLEYFRKRYNG